MSFSAHIYIIYIRTLSGCILRCVGVGMEVAGRDVFKGVGELNLIWETKTNLEIKIATINCLATISDNGNITITKILYFILYNVL